MNPLWLSEVTPLTQQQWRPHLSERSADDLGRWSLCLRPRQRLQAPPLHPEGPGQVGTCPPTHSTRGGAHRGQGCWELSGYSVLIRGDLQGLHSLVLVSLRGRDTPQFSQNSPWNSPGQNTEVGSLSLVQGIFPTPGSNPGLPHYRQIPYQLSHEGSPSHRTEVFISQNPKTLKASLWTGITLLSPTGPARSTWEALIVL